MFRERAIQAKLAVSQADDPDEREADGAAEQVVAGKPVATIQRRCVACEEGESVQPKLAPARAPRAGPTAARGLTAVPAGGQPLPAPVRSFFEPQFGFDFGQVSIHTDSAAATSAQAIQARAYTAGRHVIFGANEYTPQTAAGQSLLAHELAHVIQQSGGPRDAPSRLQREPDDSASAGAAGEFDPEDELETALSVADAMISVSDHKTAMRILRYKLLLQASEPTWPDQAAFDKFDKECLKTAESEPDTMAALGDPDLTNPEAFPETWANRLKPTLSMNYPQYLLQREVVATRDAMEKSGQAIPNEIYEHGWPLNFAASVQLQAVQLSSPLGVSFQWTTKPPGSIPVASGPLVEFTSQALKYLHALQEADFISRWIQIAESVVQEVRNGELSVDPEAYERYKKKRPGGVSPDEVESSQLAGIPEPLSGKIDPAIAEDFVTRIAGITAFFRSFVHAGDVTSAANVLIAQANSLVAAENPVLRQNRANRWGHEHGFYSDAIEQQWDDIKEHALDIGIGIAEDIGKYTVLELIPFINIVTNIYLVAQLVIDVADTIGDLEAADEEARNAKTAAALQRAAAHQATALSAAARKVATAIVMHHASKAARKLAGKARDWATGDAAKGGTEPAGAVDDPIKVKEAAKEKVAKAEKDFAKDPATEKLPGEPTKDLPNHGEARITHEGHCKICRSPCRYEVDVARDVLNATLGTRYEGYAQNLLTRIQLLDEAMEASVKHGATRTDMKSRFYGAFSKLSVEIEAAQQLLAGTEKGIDLPAAKEIDSFAREHGIMDDPARYQSGVRQERGWEGTAYHKRIEVEVVRSLPHDSAFTEDTIQDYLRRQGVDAAAIPDPSTGIDVYILDNPRNLMVPVDITNVAGGKWHVRKLVRNVTAMRGALEHVGIRLTEPIEIEYVGMSFDEAAASIVAELKAFAHAPKP